MAIGPTLQEARLKKQLTTSQVAEKTRMKVQMVEDLEHDDFHRIAATIYGKGFIKLFAEAVGLDPAPLIADYVRNVKGDQPSLIPDENTGNAPAKKDPPAASKPSATNQEPEAAEDQDLFAYAKQKPAAASPSASAPTAEPPVVAPEPPLTERLKKQWTQLLDTCREQGDAITTRLAEIHWGDAPIKAVGIVIGILLVLLFVISGISRCSGRHNAAPPPNDVLDIAVDPPEPYFD